jgi:tetratricopeptide (TPR) repeat protein
VKIIVYYIFLIFLAETAMAQKDPDNLFKKAKMNFEDGKYDEAIYLLNEVVKNDTTDEEAYYYLGRSYLEINSFDSAILNFNLGINAIDILAPSKSDYYLYRGIAHRSDSAFFPAARDFESAKKLNPSDAKIYFEDAILQNIMDKDKKVAIDELGTAIDLDPGFAPYYAKRAELKVMDSKYAYDSHSALESALGDITYAISLDPPNYEYFRIRSEIYKEIGEPLLAVEDYNEMIKLEPEKIKAYTERGIIRMQNDEYSGAIRDFTSAIIHDPGNEKNFRYRGLCKYNSADYQGAFEDFSSAIKLLTNDEKQSQDQDVLHRVLADTYIKRGVSSYSMGNSFNACTDFRKAYDLGASRALNYYRKYCGF